MERDTIKEQALKDGQEVAAQVTEQVAQKKTRGRPKKPQPPPQEQPPQEIEGQKKKRKELDPQHVERLKGYIAKGREVYRKNLEEKKKRDEELNTLEHQKRQLLELKRKKEEEKERKKLEKYEELKQFLKKEAEQEDEEEEPEELAPIVEKITRKAVTKVVKESPLFKVQSVQSSAVQQPRPVVQLSRSQILKSFGF